MKDLGQGQRILLLGGIVFISFFLNFFNIGAIGYGNEYYAATVRSMLQNWHNFFFASYDPAGFITVDKPPVAFWIQTAFAKVLGYKGWVLMLPQALAGSASVIVLYRLIVKKFGAAAALLSSLIFAVTPIAVAISRTNNIDSILVFSLLLATVCLFKAVDEGKAGWLMATAVLMGISFNIKMLQAYMILPALALLYLLFAKTSWKKRILQLLAAGVIMAGLSFSWALAVDSVSADNRPYIGSSTDNTVTELIVGHNGLKRWQGMTGGSSTAKESAASEPASGTGTMPGGDQSSRSMQGGGGVGGVSENGDFGLQRLFNEKLGGQIGWVLPFALMSAVLLLRSVNWRKPLSLTPQQQMIVFWIFWLAPMIIFFSYAGFFHRYYLIMLAPAIGALAGIGFIDMAKLLRTDSKLKWLLPGTLAVTVIYQLTVVYQYSSVRTWLLPVMAVLLAAGLILPFMKRAAFRKAGLSLSVAAMLIAPFTWSAITTQSAGNTTTPAAGPQSQNDGPGGGMGIMPPDMEMPNNMMPTNREDGGAVPASSNGQTAQADPGEQARSFKGGFGRGISTELQKYLLANYKEGQYLVAASSSQQVSKLIIETGLPAIAYGGFSGSDNALTVEKLQNMVESGKLKYIMMDGRGGMGGMQGGGQSELSAWIQEHAKAVPTADIYGSDSATAVQTQLYEFTN